jgi:thiamine-phosphate pyrophosphorylase
MFFTDPARTPHPERVIAALPRGAAVVFRPFGAVDALAQGRKLRALARSRGVLFLVGADAALAAALSADGLHLPQRLAHRAGASRRAHPRWLVTAAAHGLAPALAAHRAGAHAVVLSPVFPSRSPSAGKTLGVLQFSQIVLATGGPVYALGGVNALTARRLLLTRAVGVAAIDGLQN